MTTAAINVPTVLECGCKVEIEINAHGGLRGGKITLPCSIHFGREKVKAPGVEYEDDYCYRIGVEIDKDNGAYKYFRTIEAAEYYWEQHGNPELVFQRKIKNTDKWMELNK